MQEPFTKNKSKINNAKKILKEKIHQTVKWT